MSQYNIPKSMIIDDVLNKLFHHHDLMIRDMVAKDKLAGVVGNLRDETGRITQAMSECRIISNTAPHYRGKVNIITNRTPTFEIHNDQIVTLKFFLRTNVVSLINRLGGTASIESACRVLATLAKSIKVSNEFYPESGDYAQFLLGNVLLLDKTQVPVSVSTQVFSDGSSISDEIDMIFGGKDKYGIHVELSLLGHPTSVRFSLIGMLFDKKYVVE